MSGTIQILDCTLRDGGQGLESLNDIGIETEIFTDYEKRKIAELIQNSGIEIIEIGCMSESVSGHEKYAVYHSIEELSKFLPPKKDTKKIFTGLYINPDTPISHIPDYSLGLVDGIREILRYSQLQVSLEHCAALAKKGYKIFIQPMLTMRYSNDELKRLIYAANEMEAYALYFVDSFGYMTEQDVERLYRFYIEELDPKIKIGFHAHNNMENALINARYFIEKLNERDRIIDSCVIGMGQGSGNLQTEIIVNYMNTYCGTCYDFNCILEICDILEKFLKNDIDNWGYSPVRFVPAVHNAAYKYAIAMKLQYHMSLVEINNILSDMPEELKHRYTAKNLRRLLDK